jgi:hypothetical protein
MKPEHFPQSNRTLHKPAGWTDDQCASLHTWTDDRTYISKWRMSWRERLRVLFSGVVWFHCTSFAHPPVCLAVENPWVNDRGWVPKWWKKWRTRRAIAKALNVTLQDTVLG